MFFVYILQSHTNGIYYVGHTDNINRRLFEHNHGKSSYTRNKGPWLLVYSEEHETKALAAKREYEIKSKKKRSYIERLIISGAHSSAG